jgi:hypothetical protein
LCVEDVNGKGLEDVNVDPEIACPEKGAVGSEGLDVDEIEFMILEDLALPFGTTHRHN